jgi:hypothetical protein
MTRVQRYHRNHDILAFTLASVMVLACAAFDAAVILAWVAA